jgi:hypothetical protein
VAALCTEVFGDLPWRYRKPADRPAKGRAHLGDWDPAAAPRFHWRKVPVPAKARISFDCAVGQCEWEFDAAANEASRLADFLDQVQAGFFSDGQASFTPSRVQLSPAEKLPSGEPVPSGAGDWTITFDESALAENALRARIIKGAAVGAELSVAPGQPVPIQRMVRRN